MVLPVCSQTYVTGWRDGIALDAWVGGWVDEWVGGWVDAWVGGWVDEWVGGWMDG